MKKKFTIARTITLSAVVVLVLVGLFFNTGTGTLSSFGWREIAAICPLGIIESYFASWTFVPRMIVVLVVVVIAGVLLGKVFCAWLCPVPPLRKFFTFEKGKSIFGKKKELPAGEPTSEPTAELTIEPAPEVSATSSLDPAFEVVMPKPCDPAKKKGCPSGCTSCVEKRKKFDSRHIVLGGALLSTAIFGFPVFCIICPVGLTFASIIALWRLVGFNEPSWALLIFPLFLAVELFVLKKWCLKFCPLGALMSLMSIPNRLFRPRVDNTKCLREKGIDCSICVSVCEENLDPHFKEGMHECTKCGLCKEKCPAQAITIPLYTPKPEKKKALKSN